MIKVNTILINQNHFPDNSLCLKFDYESFRKTENETPYIEWLYENDGEMFTIECIVDILHRLGYYKINLNLPYVPHARMDRIKSPDENFSLKVFAKWLNSLNFYTVRTLNVHSNVSEALINNIQNYLPEEDIYNVCKEYNPDVIFFPDEGACKRYSDMKIIKELDLPIAFGIKKRDWKTGNILGLNIVNSEIVNGKRVLVIDDICSRGGTFFHSATKLKSFGATDVALYVSHCENTVVSGELLETDWVNTIYTTDSICTLNHEKLKFVKKFR